MAEWPSARLIFEVLKPVAVDDEEAPPPRLDEAPAFVEEACGGCLAGFVSQSSEHAENVIETHWRVRTARLGEEIFAVAHTEGEQKRLQLRISAELLVGRCPFNVVGRRRELTELKGLANIDGWFVNRRLDAG